MMLISGWCAPLGIMLAGSMESLLGEFGIYMVLGFALIVSGLAMALVTNFDTFMNLTPARARVFLKVLTMATGYLPKSLLPEPCLDFIANMDRKNIEKPASFLGKEKPLE